MKVKTSTTIESELRDEIDRRAEIAGISRSWLINRVLLGWVATTPFDEPVETSDHGSGRQQAIRRASEASAP
ncbi:MAG: hypothetical protein ABSA13_14215 [Beijerinckiaceae bacterium]|jgi:hypothetical protein